jgi:hypothetical protein
MKDIQGKFYTKYLEILNLLIGIKDSAALKILLLLMLINKVKSYTLEPVIQDYHNKCNNKVINTLFVLIKAMFV